MLISIVASETSTVTFLSIPGLAFQTDGSFKFLQLAAGFVVGRIAVAWLILPLYFRSELLTSYELLDQKLGLTTQRLTSGLFLIARTTGDALRLFLTALVLYKVINLNMPICVVVVGAATIVYTFYGGLKSVVWNDCIQFAVYMVGVAWALLAIVHSVGGWTEIWDFGIESNRFQIVDWHLGSPGINLWAGLIGGGFLSFATHGTDHMVVQRLLGARTQVDATRAMILSGIVVFLQFAFFLLIGVALACFFDKYPPEKSFEANDEVFVTFIATQLQPGVVGLILAAVFAAAMSTQSSSLNSSAAAFVNDFYKTFARTNCSDGELLRVGKLATAGFGLLQMGVALFAYFFLVQNRSVVDLVFEIASFAYGPVLGMFFLAIVNRRLTERIAVLAFATGLTIIIGLKLWTLTPGISINGLWFTTIGSLATLAVGFIAGRFIRQAPAKQ